MRPRIVILLVWMAAVALVISAPRAATLSDEWTAAVTADWKSQDGIEGEADYSRALAAIRRELGQEDVGEPDASSPGEFYLEACHRRRAHRLQTLLARAPRIVFTKHYDLGGSHYAYTEGQSDAQSERHFVPGSSLCLLTLDGRTAQLETLITDAGGVIRDPDVSYDARRVLFAWKKSLDEDDYHLYELQLSTGSVRQLTSGLGFADYEGVYLPDGHIVFNSTRCVQTVDCWWTEVSNLYTCDGDGRYLRRLSFDQVHTNYPTVTPDGRILYSRWDYNDRGQIFPQGLFQMNPDGTGQTEFYGNNSWFPTTILHARGIPNSPQVLAIFTGHHTLQQGWVGTLDAARGRQENQGAQLIAPVRETRAVRIDRYGQSGHQFQYPYPLNESEFLVAARFEGTGEFFAIYWMNRDGRRELLVADRGISCNQPVPLWQRAVPSPRRRQVDYQQSEGIIYLQNIAGGPGLAGVPPGAIRQLRVVALEFRAAGIGDNRSHGEAGGALSSTPVSIGNGAWDVKRVLGEATVHSDGSALFSIPARTPVYFQALDEHGQMVQTMRSWCTLQPGETMSCVGCHENKNSAPPALAPTQALRAGVEHLAGESEPVPGFSFAREIQPILDRHCVTCHYLPVQLDGHDLARAKEPHEKPSTAPGNDDARPSFSLRSLPRADGGAKRNWSESYLVLTCSRPEEMGRDVWSYSGQPNEWVRWISVQTAPPMLPPYYAGSSQSRLLAILRAGHEGVQLSHEEMRKLACWIDLSVPYCGDYREAAIWAEDEVRKYEHFLSKRQRMAAIEEANIREFIIGTQQ